MNGLEKLLLSRRCQFRVWCSTPSSAQDKISKAESLYDLCRSNFEPAPIGLDMLFDPATPEISEAAHMFKQADIWHARPKFIRNRPRGHHTPIVFASRLHTYAP